MQLRDYVKFNSDFRDSVNLYLDLNKTDKIKSYIPTKSSVDILEQYLDAVLENKQHSTLLIGPYGKGKSHLLLMLLATLTLENNAKNDSLMLELENKINSNFDKTYPVGSIYISTSGTNPSTIYGGTWERYGQGKTLVGLNESETEFSTVNKIGGEKTHTLTINEMPSHNHQIGSGDGSNGLIIGSAPESNILVGVNNYYIKYDGVGNGPSTYLNTYNVGGSSDHNNLQPYITVYMWKRTS